MKEPPPSMTAKGNEPLAAIPVNGEYVLAIYQGSLSEHDILIKYRQLENGKWSRLRTPKHIHWAVDILIKHYIEPKETDLFLESLLQLWDKTEGLHSMVDRQRILNENNLMDQVNKEAANYPKLAKKGEYSVKFLLLLAKLLMIQEKTNRSDAYMFKDLLHKLKNHKNIFEIVSTASHTRTR